MCVLKLNKLLPFSPDIEFLCSYLQCHVQDTPLYKITAREQISSLIKQVIGWHLKGSNSDVFFEESFVL